jgi:nucleotide-binding universal stress UspA family protein
MRAILAVLDLTDGSDEALATAARLAGLTGSSLHVVHSMEVVGMPLWEAIQTDVGRRIRDAKSALAEQLLRAVPGGCTVTSCALDFHNLQDSILLRAREAGADLIVFGAADPRTPGGARHLGALQDVAEVSAIPCLLVRKPLHHPFGRVLLPLSAAEIGQGVLADACDWLASLAGPARSGRPLTELQVLHVASERREWREHSAELDRELDWARDQRQWTGCLRMRRSIRWSAAAHMEILSAAAGQAPDLVLLGPGCGTASSPDHARAARMVLLRRLPCPVLVLPGTLRADEEGGGSRLPPHQPEPPAYEEPEAETVMEIAAAGD